ncbi:MAG: hypothetical protein JJE13_05985 [Thermoleophilia bacterium]|nr:hypothetical protein [Thermoleophilia bacterium]
MFLLAWAFASSASAQSPFDAALSASKAKSEVSIEIWPNRGLFGYVESGRKKCETRRRVRVFKKLPGGKLRAIGSDRATKTDSGFIWSLKSRKGRSGTVVASVAATGRCAGDSARKRIPVSQGDYPSCPSLADICHLDQMKIEDDDHYYDKACPTFGTGWSGECKIVVTKGRVPYCCWALGTVRWTGRSATRRDFEFWAQDFIEVGHPKKPGPEFHGWIPNDRSPNFYVNSAKLPPWTESPKTEWYTPEVPGAAAGTPGGPIFLNWDATIDNHFNFYIGGFLYRKK